MSSIKLETYKQQWNLKEVAPLCQTPRGHLYRCQYDKKEAVLKIYTGAGIQEEHRGVEFLKSCLGHGVINVFEDDESAVLLEYCCGPTLESVVQNGHDAYSC